MASATSQTLALRDSDASSSSSLTTGAIVGIACGAGALFLGAAGLFIIYWRRQRQYDREDYGDSFDERGPQGVMGPAVTYTMDYKMDESEHREGDHASAYTYSPEKPTYPFSPMSGSETASAMPTHPAYIPRALVRGAATPSNRSNRSTATTSPPPFPTPPFPSAVSSGSKTQPDDTMIQAYLYAAAAAPGGGPQPTPPHLQQPQDLPDAGGLPTHPSPPNTLPRHPHPHSQPQPQPSTTLPAHISPPNSAASTTDAGHYSSGGGSTHPLRGRSSSGSNSNSNSNSKPRAYHLPPRLNLSPKPLQGRENTTISGPLAFPQHYGHPGPGQPGQPGQSSVSSSGWARDEFPDGEEQPSSGGGRRGFFSNGSGSGAGGGGEGKGKDKEKERKKKEKKHGRQRSGGNRHYAEIEIGRGSDIW